jgi:hypothetical protein
VIGKGGLAFLDHFHIPNEASRGEKLEYIHFVYLNVLNQFN